MKLARQPFHTFDLLNHYREIFEALGASCDQTWHDQMVVLAEGLPAEILGNGPDLCERRLHFIPPEQSGPRNLETEVFAGAPLTFNLAEKFASSGPNFFRAIFQFQDEARNPGEQILERAWSLQFPHYTRWKPASNWIRGWHFSMVGLIRVEIQATDQHWFLHRTAVSLPDGEPDPHLASQLDFAQPHPQGELEWPPVDWNGIQSQLESALKSEMEEMAAIEIRQQAYLRKELGRIDEYFQQYENELRARFSRKSAKAKGGPSVEERLEAARQERLNRRRDQIQRHEIRVHYHWDAGIYIAEPALAGTISFHSNHQLQSCPAEFCIRNRRFYLHARGGG